MTQDAREERRGAPSGAASQVGTHGEMRAIARSFIALFAAATLQLVVALGSGSVSLLVDALHNFGDAATAGPLWVAFTLERRRPSERFTYGLGRVEDVAGVFVVGLIFSSAVAAAYVSLTRFLHPHPMDHLWAVAAASVIGFVGNETAARYRIRGGRAIGSAALVADGEHGRVDGLASLAVLVSAAGAWAGYPMVDPIVGVLMTLLILHLLWESGGEIFVRLLDGVEPHVVHQVRETAGQTPDVNGVTETRVRWVGHRLYAEVNVAVDPALSVADAHRIAMNVESRLLETLRFLSHATIHVDPLDASGEAHHHQSDRERSR